MLGTFILALFALLGWAMCEDLGETIREQLEEIGAGEQPGEHGGACDPGLTATRAAAPVAGADHPYDWETHGL